MEMNVELSGTPTWLLFTGVVIAICSVVSWRAAQAARVEQPAYVVLDTFEQFELRSYPRTVQAQTVLLDRSRSSMSAGFRILARYIFGGNERSQQIAMTAPVTRSRAGTNWLLNFNMPADLRLSSLPTPRNSAVRLVVVPERSMAALRFKGRVTPHRAQVMEDRLARAMVAAGIIPAGEAVLAQYDPPMQLPHLRRSEILVPVELVSQMERVTGVF
jgi:hypothetical protein